MTAARSRRPLPSVEPDELTVRLVPMVRRHLRGVLRIEEQVYPQPWSLGLFMSEIALGATRVYGVAMIDREVVGYAGVLFGVDEAHVTTLAVDPAFQRHGVGTRLLLLLARQAANRGAEHLTLEVRMGNEPALRLYQRFGFVPAGVRKNYYAETREDALVMWAHDIQAPSYATRLAGIEAGIIGHTITEGFGLGPRQAAHDDGSGTSPDAGAPQ